MDAHKTVLLEALAGLSELDFPMQDILELQLQVVLLRRKAVSKAESAGIESHHETAK